MTRIYIGTVCFLLACLTFAYSASVPKNNAAVFCRTISTIYKNKNRDIDTTHISIAEVDLDLCTHLLIGRGSYVEPLKWSIKPPVSSSKPEKLVSLSDIAALKNRKKDLKIVMSVDYSISDFVKLIEYDRNTFIHDAKNFLKKYNIDGLNFDTYYADESRIGADGRQKFIALIKELQAALKSNGLLLTTTLATPPWAAPIDISNLIDLFDYWFILPIEYYGVKSNKIMPHAPMETTETIGVKKSAQDAASRFGSATNKLILGVPFYGKRYELVTALKSDNENPIGKPFRIIYNGNSTHNRITYNKICPLTKTTNWRYGWDSLSQTPFLVRNFTVITYENEQSISAKVKMARKEKFAGIMIFTLEMDDFDGDCAKGATFPLLRAVHDNLK